ncbi:ATP-dependent DNA helicase DinG [Streptococcus gallinaceus]|uniref:bifunctional DnaQ family exonuclease/ATP-dependent helicase n=1 Tax=Streptococcus gallinaceus TaxID=165758 RepID=UPI0020A097D3|nr:bifunctional DnaQ family exonuclease/ATP-dependent helicase [Streptococcus gallinaceus]MCP1639020.1 ATP-dependent DNA helicase DinG [Streptococcus gallinaceus]MCP1769736.1 ATP-dependent DNA helicase DinG [Streptococcus gallinaceus]
MYSKKGNKYAVVDLEATGTGSKAKIIQIGIVIVQDGKIQETYQTDINPYEKLDNHIKELTGISDGQLAQAPDFGQVAREIYELIGDAIFVAHNVKFDANLLAEALFFEGFDLLTPRVDTVELSQIFFPTFEKYNLSVLAEKLDLNLDQAHTAIADAMATAQLLLKIQEKIRSLPKQTVGQILDLADNLLYESRLVIDEIYPHLSDYLSERFELVHGLVLKKPAVTPSPRQLSTDFALNLALLGLEKREQQAIFADAVSHRLASPSGVHFIQGQAGIGKTYGYLLPILSQTSQAVLVVVPTKVLQGQVMENEGKNLADTFHISLSSIKAARHYLHLGKFSEVLEGQDDNRLMNLCKIQVLVWLTETETGDLDEFQQQYRFPTFYDAIRHDGQLLEQSFFQGWDFWEKVQKKARMSRVLVTNHTYLLEHIKDQSALFTHRILVVDEAQRFLLAVEEFSSQTMDLAQILQLLQSKRDKATDLLEKRLLESTSYELDRISKLRGRGCALVSQDLQQIRQNLAELRDNDLQELADMLVRFDDFWLEDKHVDDRRVPYLRGSFAEMMNLQEFLSFEKQFYISATLQLTKHLTMADLLGFEDVTVDTLPSQPVENQQIFLPTDLPNVLDYEESEHAHYIAQRLISLKELQEPMLVLFTSTSLLLSVSEILEQMDVPHLAQHKYGTDLQLKKRFECGEGKLLLGTGAFWQGVDFAQQDKMLLVLVRLPFDHPEDRLTQKINHSLRQSGKSPFYDYSLPMMMVRLKQALGRTNRRQEQRSAIILLDPRLLSKKYGKQVRDFLSKDYILDKTPVAHLNEKIQAFLEGGE